MIALLGYNAMQIGLYGLFAAAAAGFVSENLGIDLPWWVYAFVGMAIIAVLGYRQVDLSVKVLVAFFARHREFDSNVFRTTIAPIVGGLAMSAVAIYAASQFGLLIGNPRVRCAGSCRP